MQSKRSERRKMAERIVEGAYTAEVQLKAAMLVIHRVARTLDAQDLPALVAQREALEKLAVFAGAHPLPADLEKAL